MSRTDILKRIAGVKGAEVEAMKRVVSAVNMKALADGAVRPVNSLKLAVKSHPVAVIAEHKRRSPSKGEISPMSVVADVAAAYATNGAAAMSVLTDTPFFGGSLEDLAVARATAPWLPLLRKEFIVDQYQIHQARLYGADAVLLIAAMLDAADLVRLNDEAHRLGLQTLVEVHSEEEIKAVPRSADLVGVNNRDLTNFSTDLSNSARLIGLLPPDAVKIAESGIRSPQDIVGLKEAGFDGFLIGEAFMKTQDPGGELASFLQACKTGVTC